MTIPKKKLEIRESINERIRGLWKAPKVLKTGQSNEIKKNEKVAQR